MREEWLEGTRVVGITSGASAPEELVQRLVDFFRARGTQVVEEFEVLREDVRFMLPKVIRQARGGAAGLSPAQLLAMKTLVVSDLHLGAARRVDLLRRPELRAPLLEALARGDRLVLLGDALELRETAAARRGRGRRARSSPTSAARSGPTARC